MSYKIRLSCDHPHCAATFETARYTSVSGVRLLAREESGWVPRRTHIAIDLCPRHTEYKGDPR